MPDEKEQRSNFQFDLYKLHVVALAAMIVFAHEGPEGEQKVQWLPTLLVCPFASFMFFCLWAHHAIVIVSMGVQPIERDVLGKLRLITFAVGTLGNFVIFPAIPLALYYEHKADHLILWWIGWALIALNFTLFVFWFYWQYIDPIRKSPQRTNA
ncbi:MAG: hypothetical protein R3C59_09095 [Planctomycetaceae bacterium]